MDADEIENRFASLRKELCFLSQANRELFASLVFNMTELLLDPAFADVAANCWVWPINVPVRKESARAKNKQPGGYQRIDQRTRSEWCNRVLDDMLQVGSGLPIDLNGRAIALSRPFTALACETILAIGRVRTHGPSGDLEASYYEVQTTQYLKWARMAQKLPDLTSESARIWAEHGFKYAQLCFGNKLEKAEALNQEISESTDAVPRTKSEEAAINYRRKYFIQAFTHMVRKRPSTTRINDDWTRIKMTERMRPLMHERRFDLIPGL